MNDVRVADSAPSPIFPQARQKLATLSEERFIALVADAVDEVRDRSRGFSTDQLAFTAKLFPGQAAARSSGNGSDTPALVSQPSFARAPSSAMLSPGYNRSDKVS